MKKKRAIEQQMSRLKQLKEMTETEKQRALDAQMYKAEIEIVSQQLEEIRRKLVSDIEGNTELINTSLLLTEKEKVKQIITAYYVTHIFMCVIFVFLSKNQIKFAHKKNETENIKQKKTKRRKE